ncbi:MAG: hypothetical protein ACPGXW_07005 [Synechococcus sp.]|jgi:hypothetical protein
MINSMLAITKVTIPRRETSGLRCSQQPIPMKLRLITSRVGPQRPALVVIPKALISAKRSNVELLGAATRLGTMAITTWDAENKGEGVIFASSKLRTTAEATKIKPTAVD